MTRRPYMPHAEKVSRASHLLTAPGKKWSESPTPRVGPDRPPRRAASPTEPTPIYYVHDGYAYNGGALDYSTNYWMNGPWQDGDLIVAVASSSDGDAITVPDGWTTLESWSVNRCRAVVAARYRDGLDSEKGSFVGSDYAASTAFRCTSPIWGSVEAVDTVASVLSTTCLLPGQGDIWPWQFMAFAKDGSGAPSTYPETFDYFSGSTGALYYTVPYSFQSDPAFWPPEYMPNGYGAAPLTTFTSTSLHSYVRGLIGVVAL